MPQPFATCLSWTPHMWRHLHVLYNKFRVQCNLPGLKVGHTFWPTDPQNNPDVTHIAIWPTHWNFLFKSNVTCSYGKPFVSNQPLNISNKTHLIRWIYIINYIHRFDWFIHRFNQFIHQIDQFCRINRSIHHLHLSPHMVDRFIHRFNQFIHRFNRLIHRIDQFYRLNRSIHHLCLSPHMTLCIMVAIPC